MILSGSDDEVGFRQKIRSAGWRKPILEYFQGSHSMGPASARPAGNCRPGFEGLSTSLTWRRNDFCRFVNPNERWFLHNRAGQRLIERELNVQPTLTVRPGWPLRVIVHKDLILTPYRG